MRPTLWPNCCACFGHKVSVAYRGDDAASLANELKPVAYLDVGMPGMDGFEGCRQIRCQTWAAGSVVIAVTGYGLPRDHDASREAGFDYHCTKPLTLNGVQNMLAPLAG